MSLSADASHARSYRPDVDGLRAIAILSVVLYHAGLSSISGGFAGVDIFFVISGFLIGGHINAELGSGTFRFSRFYRNRAKRILPALYAVLLTVLLVAVLLFSPDELRDFAKYLFATTASVSNVALWRTTNYFAPRADENPLLMTWSLGVEEQFYVVIPILLVLLLRIRKRLSLPSVVTLSALSFVAATYEVHRSPTSAFYLLGSRAWELGVGVALAIVQAEYVRWPDRRHRLACELVSGTGLLLVIGSLFLLSPSTPFPGPAALPCVLGSALLLASGTAWINRKLLSSPPLVFVGRISYSFYLVHWPLLSFLRILRGGSLPLAWGLGAVVVAFGLAIVSYRLVEIPFRSSPRSPGPLLIRYGVASLVLLVVSGVIFESDGLRWRYASATAIDDSFKDLHVDACLSRDGDSAPQLIRECTGSDAPGPHAAIWGDSHASALSGVLRTTLAQQGLFLEEYGKTACPPLSGVGRRYRGNPPLLKDCIQFNRAVLERLQADPSVSVVILYAFWDAAFDPRSSEGKLSSGTQDQRAPTQTQSEELLRSSLRNTLEALRAAGKQVVVFGDTPVFLIDPVWRIRSNSIPLRRYLAQTMGGSSFRLDPGVDQAFDDTEEQRAAQVLLQTTAASVPGVTFWDPRRALCQSEYLCTYRQDRTMLFLDTNHVSPAGAQRALQGWVLPARM